jgi:GNAT superfamily N-acetyltransferase
MLDIINSAASAYRGVIPADRWHEPYMTLGELRAEMASGVVFSAYAVGGQLVGVMGVQNVRNVRLIRHAYVLTDWQGTGVGSKLLDHLRSNGGRPILVGTWQAASWAVRFYQRHGFELVPGEAIVPLLRAFWTVPDRQIATSVVLTSPGLSVLDATELILAI